MSAKVIHDPRAALADLAKQINAEHEAVVASLRTSVERAIALGELLTKARKQVGHGRWERWVAANTKVGARMARNYMKLAALGAEDRKRVSDLGVRQALDAIERATPSPEVGAKVKTVKRTIVEPYYPRSADTHLPHAIAPPVVASRGTEPDRSAWTDAEIEAHTGQKIASHEETVRGDLLGLATIAVRVSNIDFARVEITDEMREAARDVVEVWTKLLEQWGVLLS